MKLPLEWLREYCSPDLDARALAERLDLTGTEVKAVTRHGVDALDRFVVGHVLEAVQHPNADRLRVCTVDVGEGEPSTIVCGAPNVAAGQAVAVARPGAVMPDGTRLGKAKLRGVASEGMILAEDELAIGTDHAGILVLEADGLPPGTPLSRVLPLATDVIDVEITPNRPDCLAVYGLAREVHAATGAPLRPAPWREDPGAGHPGEVPVEIVVEAPDLCPRFTARAYEAVELAPSPPWLKARLTAAGQRPINNVVDITNYVMLLTGQPIHAFDLDRIAGARLVVRRARDGEELTTLDGQLRRLTREDCLIADEAGPTSLAGIMGGERSEVQADTTRVLMEVAAWHGPAINATSARLGLRSEASGRFEKSLAPEQTMDAQAVVARLMREVVGARQVGGTVDVGGPGPAPATLRLREARVGGLLGIDVPRDEQAELLGRLELGVAPAPDGLDVTVPYWRRNDLTREADLIEEVARLHGLEDLPATLPSRRGATGVLSPEQRLRRRAEDVLVGRGLHEAVGWSFTEPGVDDRLRLPGDDPRRRHVVVENPMSEDQSVLRTTLLGSLLDAVRRNVSRGNDEVALFERGAVYLPSGERLPHEHQALAALVVGSLASRSWSAPADGRAPRVFLAKALVEALLHALRVPFAVLAEPEPFLHPGRAGRIVVEGEEVGWFGELHPLVARAWDLEDPVGFELDLDAVIARAPRVPGYRDLTSFPELRQDLAVVVDAEVPAARVVDVVREAAGPLLARADVFDVYTGPPVPEGRRSLALALAFRAPDRTLTDEDVAPLRERVVAALHERVGGELRG